MRSNSLRLFGFKSPGIVRILKGADINEVAEALEILGLGPKEGLDVGKGHFGADVRFLVDQAGEVFFLQKDNNKRLLLEVRFAIQALREHPFGKEAEAAARLELHLEQGVALQSHFNDLGLAVRRIKKTIQEEQIEL